MDGFPLLSLVVDGKLKKVPVRSIHSPGVSGPEDERVRFSLEACRELEYKKGLKLNRMPPINMQERQITICLRDRHFCRIVIRTSHNGKTYKFFS